MAKVRAELTFIVLLMFVVVACAPDEPPAGASAASEESDGAATTEEVAEASGDCAEVTANASHHITADSAAHVGLETLASEVDAATDGRVTIEIFSDAQLGGLAEMTENLQADVVQIALIDSGTLSQFDGELGVLDLPFLFEEMDEYNELLDSEFGEVYSERAREVGVEPLYTSAVGLRSMFFTDAVVHGPDDLRGLTMRVPEAPVWVDTFRALGTSPAAIPGGELYTSAQTGVVDGFELPHGSTVDLSLQEVVNSMTVTGHILTNIMIAASPQFVDGLCEADRAALFAAADAARDVTREAWFDDNEQAEGVLFAELEVVDDPDLDAFREAVRPVHDEFTDEHGRELYDQVTEFLGRWTD